MIHSDGEEARNEPLCRRKMYPQSILRNNRNDAHIDKKQNIENKTKEVIERIFFHKFRTSD